MSVNSWRRFVGELSVAHWKSSVFMTSSPTCQLQRELVVREDSGLNTLAAAYVNGFRISMCKRALFSRVFTIKYKVSGVEKASTLHCP